MHQIIKRADDAEKEVERLRAAIRKHRGQKGDDRCWLDDRELYAALPEGVGDADLSLDDPETMMANCRRFIQSRQDPSCPYKSPQREIERLQELVKSLADRVAAQSELLSQRAEKAR